MCEVARSSLDVSDRQYAPAAHLLFPRKNPSDFKSPPLHNELDDCLIFLAQRRVPFLVGKETARREGNARYS